MVRRACMFVPTWVLLLLAAGAVVAYLNRRRPFTPFYVKVMPNWKPLLEDHLQMTEERWATLRERAQSRRAHGDTSALDRGIWFTVLQSDPDRGLVYSNHSHTFHTQVDIHEPVPELEEPAGKSRA